MTVLSGYYHYINMTVLSGYYHYINMTVLSSYYHYINMTVLSGYYHYINMTVLSGSHCSDQLHTWGGWRAEYSHSLRLCQNFLASQLVLCFGKWQCRGHNVAYSFMFIPTCDQPLQSYYQVVAL